MLLPSSRLAGPRPVSHFVSQWSECCAAHIPMNTDRHETYSHCGRCFQIRCPSASDGSRPTRLWYWMEAESYDLSAMVWFLHPESFSAESARSRTQFLLPYGSRLVSQWNRYRNPWAVLYSWNTSYVPPCSILIPSSCELPSFRGSELLFQAKRNLLLLS